MISDIARRVVLLWGWKRALLACAAGALAALAMPPFGLFPVLLISFPLAIWLIDGSAGAGGSTAAALLRSGVAGWFFGFGYFLAGLWWIGSAFLVNADIFVWFMPFAVIGLPAVLGLFHALGFALARLVWPAGAARILSFACALALCEWLRGHVFTGFPWNMFGYALTSQSALAQTLAVLGAPGLTLVTLIIFASPATLAGDGASTRGSWRLPLASLAILAAMATGGAYRLAETPQQFVPGVKLRLVQPNTPQDARFDPSNRDTILNTFMQLSNRTIGPDAVGMSGVTALIWPESSFPFLLSRDANALADISNLLQPKSILLTGAMRAEPAPGDDERTLFFNSVHVIDNTGAIVDSYDKVHLVPFGEYLPWRSALEALGFEELTRQRGGFTAGTRMRTLDVAGLPPVGILVCYEAIFPGSVTDPGRRPGWLLNVTNDAWFGRTPGPYQHLLQARARSIEEGLPLVRSANDGVSAVFDPLGRQVVMLPLGMAGVVDSPLPVAAPPTIYARLGDRSMWVLLVLFEALALFRLMKPSQRRNT